MKKITISDEETLTFYGITWNDGWEFDAPSVITSPGYFYSDSYDGLSGLIEYIIENLSIDFEIYSENDIEEWRNWKVEQFDEFIKDLFDRKPTIIPDYFKKFKKEIETVWITKQTVKFKWNEENEWYDCENVEIIEKTIELNLINEKN